MCVIGLKVMERLKIDDVVGAVPAHLFSGVWGTLAVCIAAGGNPGVQLVGILAVAVFAFGASWLTWIALFVGLVAEARVTACVLGIHVAFPVSIQAEY